MRVLTHPLVSAVALSMFCSLSLIAALVSPEHIWVYHHFGSPTPIFGGVMLFFAITWALLATVLLLAGRSRTAGLVVWTGIVVLLPYVFVQQLQNMQVWKVSHLLNQAIFVLCAGVWLAWIWRWRRVPQPGFERMHGLTTTLLGFAALGSVFTLVQLAWCYHQALAIERPAVLHRPTRQVAYRGSPHHRVIWIVLDELSYDQLYGDRYPGLALPEFDHMAGESIVFGDVSPAANETRIALPAMLTGLHLDGIRAAASGSRVQLLASKAQPVAFEPGNSVFGDAVKMGASTGVAGWYNPYCRILGPALDRCFQTMEDEFQEGMSPRGTVLRNALAPYEDVLREIASPLSGRSRDLRVVGEQREARMIEYNTLVKEGDDLLSDDSIDLAFLHMPFPHPPGFYDRHTGELTTGPSTYLDNLVVSDRYLTHVRQLLTARGEWDRDAILITGDHSWRTILLWREGVDWSPEEQQTTQGGQFDSRPAWILKLPGQGKPVRIDTPVDAVVARTLVRNLLSGGVKTADAVASLTRDAGPDRHEQDRALTPVDPGKRSLVELTRQRDSPAE